MEMRLNKQYEYLSVGQETHPQYGLQTIIKIGSQSKLDDEKIISVSKTDIQQLARLFTLIAANPKFLLNLKLHGEIEEAELLTE